ncbi:hypothetical protein FRAHR75_210006 [Frankia sp. Hr75.2]|nr:hypothetical protein FRAHR75_210006 [Frankia sp. Hr75.2]
MASGHDSVIPPVVISRKAADFSQPIPFTGVNRSVTAREADLWPATFAYRTITLHPVEVDIEGLALRLCACRVTLRLASSLDVVPSDRSVGAGWGHHVDSRFCRSWHTRSKYCRSTYCRLSFFDDTAGGMSELTVVASGRDNR